MSARVRFDSIDAVRGLGAVAIVFWHWQHMLLLSGPKYTFPPLTGPFRNTEPFYALFSPLYEFGFRAVDLFFVISGFVFYLLYQKSIAEGRTPARDFFVLRLSRLYPLHLLTLLLVAVVQYFFLARTHQTFVYYGYDVPHFMGNLFLLNAPHYSFNGPTWALTVEALLYLIFWRLARTGILRSTIVTAFLVGLGLWLLIAPGPEWLGLGVWGRGIAGFFAGGLACRLYTLARGRNILMGAVTVASIAGWVATVVIAYTRPNLGAALSPDANMQLQFGLIWSMQYILFPLSIVALALWDEKRAKPIPAFTWLGSISYSAYVLHFPLQLIVAVAVVYGLGPTDFGLNPFAMLGFFVVLFVLARLTFLRLEEPLQSWIRKHWIGPPRAQTASKTA